MKYFGTDGIRGSYGSENMCDEFALELGKAIGHFLQLKLDRSPVVALAMDTRPSSPALKNAIAIGLRHMSVEVLDFGIAPTPALAFGVIHQKADFRNILHQDKNLIFLMSACQLFG